MRLNYTSNDLTSAVSALVMTKIGCAMVWIRNIPDFFPNL